MLQQAFTNALCHVLTSRFSAQFSDLQCLLHKAQEQTGKAICDLLQIGIVAVITLDSAALQVKEYDTSITQTANRKYRTTLSVRFAFTSLPF